MAASSQLSPALRVAGPRRLTLPAWQSRRAPFSDLGPRRGRLRPPQAVTEKSSSSRSRGEAPPPPTPGAGGVAGGDSTRLQQTMADLDAMLGLTPDVPQQPLGAPQSQEGGSGGSSGERGDLQISVSASVLAALAEAEAKRAEAQGGSAQNSEELQVGGWEGWGEEGVGVGRVGSVGGGWVEPPADGRAGRRRVGGRVGGWAEAEAVRAEAQVVKRGAAGWVGRTGWVRVWVVGGEA